LANSMTGFGRFEGIIEGVNVALEIKSVNHRYFELNCRLPRTLGFLEERLKSELQPMVSRGKLDLFLGLDLGENGEITVNINHELASAYVAALRELCGEYSLKDDVSCGLLARNNDILTARRLPPDEDFIWSVVSEALNSAVASFKAMRAREGARLAADIFSRLDALEVFADEIEKRQPETVAEYREKIHRKMADLLQSAQVDEQRILMEAAMFADKIATDEETVRLRSHISQFRAMLKSDQPIGRKLDFLLQEMNRECNTIGSKAQDISVTQDIVDMKAELEKIREQIQNIE